MGIGGLLFGLATGRFVIDPDAHFGDEFGDPARTFFWMIVCGCLASAAGLVFEVIWRRISRRGPERRGPSVGEVLALLLLVGMAGVTYPLIWARRVTTLRAHCMNNMKQIAIALHEYERVEGHLPPAYVADSQGRPMHSWRVLILPYLEQAALYNAYNFSQPWDGPDNTRLIAQMPGVFRCPHQSRRRGSTSYVVVPGPDTAFAPRRAIRLGDITDRKSATVLVVEIPDSTIPWTRPDDLDVAAMEPVIAEGPGRHIGSAHPGGANAAFADGSVHFLRSSIPPKALRALLTIRGGEFVDPSQF
jgi:prepilin-type processing-associated H-X9-DG protein